MKEKYYSKDKCKCIAGKEIVGMGKPSDEHLYCHECDGCLAPWERHTKICGGCKMVKHYQPLFQAQAKEQRKKEKWTKFEVFKILLIFLATVSSITFLMIWVGLVLGVNG